MEEVEQWIQELRRRVRSQDGPREAASTSWEKPLHEGEAAETVDQDVRELPGLLSELKRDFQLPLLPTSAASPVDFIEVSAPVTAPDAAVERRTSYQLGDFLRHHDAKFVRTAYVGLLGREPDPPGLAASLEELRSGRSSKVALLWKIRHSEEGMRRAVKVGGLGWAFNWERLRRHGVSGYVFSWVNAFFTLPNLLRRLEHLELEVSTRTAREDLAWRTAVERVAAAFAARDVQLAELAQASTSRAGLEAMAARLVETGSATYHAHVLLAELRRGMAGVEGKLERLEAEIISADDIPDDFYVAFENRFRGTPEDVRQRVEVYLPFITGAGAGGEDRPIVDIGCGRGEWLDLLRANGLLASGVDLNKAMVDVCSEKGLSVLHADALDYLQGRSAQSMGAITAFHVIEHLPFGRILTLLDACHRALKSGGVVILETPNPENVTVGSCNFWYDPTHRAPLPPQMMEWLLGSHGFERVQILRLHPVDPSLRTQAGDESVRKLLDEKFHGPQDYAVIGYKA